MPAHSFALYGSKLMEDIILKIMFVSFIFLLFFYYYIKYLLVQRGEKTHLFLDYGKDYHNLKRVTEYESNSKLKEKYISAMFFLKTSAFILIGATIVAVIFTSFR